MDRLCATNSDFDPSKLDLGLDRSSQQLEQQSHPVTWRYHAQVESVGEGTVSDSEFLEICKAGIVGNQPVVFLAANLVYDLGGEPGRMITSHEDSADVSESEKFSPELLRSAHERVTWEQRFHLVKSFNPGRISL